MKAMKMKNRRVWLAVIGSASLLAVITALAIYILTVGVEQTFTGSVTWLAHAFADEASRYIAMADQDNQNPQETLRPWAQKVVQDYLFYAQVVKDGKTLVEEKAPQAINLDLNVGTPSSEMSVVKGRLPDGTPYLDLIRILESSDGNVDSGSYLRMGISLARVHSGVWTGTLILAGVGLAGIFSSSILIFYVGGARAARAPEPVTVPEFASVRAGAADNRQDGDNSLWKVGKLQIDDRSKKVQINGHSVRLTPREYEVLKLLASEPDRVFSNQKIIAQVWPENSVASADDVRKYIRFLRHKLEENPTRPQLILTIKGFGYKLAP